MGGNSPIPYRDVKRALERGGANHVSTNGSHFIWKYKDKLPFAIVVHKNEVKAPYIKRLRRQWALTANEGVKDDDFWNGNWNT